MTWLHSKETKPVIHFKSCCNCIHCCPNWHGCKAIYRGIFEQIILSRGAYVGRLVINENQGWIFFRKAAISSGNNFTYLRFGEGFEVMDKKKWKKIKKKKRKKKRIFKKKKIVFLPHWDFLPSPLGKDCSSLYNWGRNFLPFPTAEGVFFTSPLWLGKEFSSLYYWGRNFLPFITGERIFFPFAPRKESSLLPLCGWGRNFLPFLLGKEFSSLLTGEGIFFPSLLGKEFLPFITGEGNCYHSSNIMIFTGYFYGYNSIMQQ